jgi:hypothetical protein
MRDDSQAWNPKQKYEKVKIYLSMEEKLHNWYIVGKNVMILIRWKWAILACLHQQHLEVATLRFQFQEQMFLHDHEPETKARILLYFIDKVKQ